jgi:lysophospholipase L1-like esterase
MPKILQIKPVKNKVDLSRLLFRNSQNRKILPFLLDGVGGIPALNQSDGIHPTAAGHKILTNNIWAVSKEIF